MPGNGPSSNNPTQRATSFEQVVERLGLSPSEYATSEELREWARKHKDTKYVPTRLLKLWGFDVNVEISEELLEKSSQHAA